jgi:hypothetical protein
MAKRFRDIVDKHTERAAIERDLALGVPLRRIAKKYGGGLNKDSLHRHKQKLPEPLKAAMLAQALKPAEDLDKIRNIEAEGLLVGLSVQRARLLLWQDSAAASEQFGVAAQISAQVHRNLELVGKYLGEFAQHHVTTSISVLISPQYLELRSALLRSLQPFPEARRAVADALHRIEEEAAQRPSQPVLEGVALPASALGAQHA